MFKLIVTTVNNFRNQAEIFYKLCNRDAILETDNTLVVAFHDDTLIGIVRLCLEHHCYVLRTMQIHPDFQGQGVGLKVLGEFQRILVERGIQTSYCMPYAHLEAFYEKIGFVKINELEAPVFLQDRVTENRIKKPQQPVILMRRHAKS